MPQKIKSKKKRGRPKFPKGKAKSYVLRVRVSREEIKNFRAKSKRTKLALPKWVRKTLTEAP